MKQQKKRPWINNWLKVLGHNENDLKILSYEENQYIEEQKCNTNLFRMRLLSIVIFFIQLTNLFVDLFTDQHKEFAIWYIRAECTMILSLLFIWLFYAYKVRIQKKKSIRFVNRFVCVLLYVFSAVTMAFHAIDIIDSDAFHNFFMLVAIIVIVPILNIKIKGVLYGLMFIAEMILLYIAGGQPTDYQWSITTLFGAFFVSDILYRNYIHNTALTIRLRLMNKELEVQNNRYTILQGLTRETIFEYDVQEDKMIVFESTKGISRCIYNYLEKLRNGYKSIIMDANEIINCYEDIKAGRDRKQVDFHTKNEAGEYLFQRGVFTSLNDENGNPTRIIGKLYILNEEQSVEE